MANGLTGTCEKHQLPLDARGGCQLCRLSGMPSKAPPAKAGRWIAVLLAVVVLGGGAALGYAAWSSVERVEPERGVLRRGPSFGKRGVVLRAPDAPSAVPLPPTPSGQRRAATAPAPSRPSLANSAREVSEEEARDALNRVRIVVYSATWCPSCRRALEYLDYNGIPYIEHDIDQDEAANARLAAINPRKSIPTFQIDDVVQVGFSPENLESRINQAVRARLESGR